VTGFAPGDRVAVGTIVDSCGDCAMCRAGQENFCYEGATSTYGGTDRVDGTQTQGGYSREYVLREKFAYRLPDGLDPAAAAPLMCAGITMWEPLRAAGAGPGRRVAVAGLGGLGHLGVKLAVALGAEVTVLSRTPDKAEDARTLGTTDLLVSTDAGQMERARGRFDLILDTISAPHDLSPLLGLLALNGTLSVVGFPIGEIPLRIMDLTYGRKNLSSSGTGGRRGTAEMLAFSAEHGITADIELLPSAKVGEALDRLDRGDVRYRFVLDLSDLG
jgi:alcohol dehydrogenase (NADP+)